MFEESILFKASSTDPKGPAAKRIKSPLSYSLSQRRAILETTVHWSQHYQCPIKLWIAEGTIKKSHKPPIEHSLYPRWFLYIEYTDDAGNNLYKQLKFNSLAAALDFAENDVKHHSLPGKNKTEKTK